MAFICFQGVYLYPLNPFIVKGFRMCTQPLIQPPHRARIHPHQTRRALQRTALRQMLAHRDGLRLGYFCIPQRHVLALAELHPTDPAMQISKISLEDIIPKGYNSDMIKTFRDSETEKVFNGRFSRKLSQDIQRIAERKLIMLHRSATLADLRIPPSNRLEAMKGDRSGQHSIRINDQWRICFVWRDDGVYEVEIVDYH